MLLCPWDFPGKSTGVGCHFLLQRIFPHCRQIPHRLSHTKGTQTCSPRQACSQVPLSSPLLGASSTPPRQPAYHGPTVLPSGQWSTSQGFVLRSKAKIEIPNNPQDKPSTHTLTLLFLCLPSLAELGLILKSTQPLEVKDCMKRHFD